MTICISYPYYYSGPSNFLYYNLVSTKRWSSIQNTAYTTDVWGTTAYLILLHLGAVPTAPIQGKNIKNSVDSIIKRFESLIAAILYF